MSRSIVALAALGAIAFVTPAAAQSAAPEAAASPWGDWGVTLTAGTDNRSKMASKSAGDAYGLGLITWADNDGRFYAAAGGEGIQSSGGSDFETQAYFGYKGSLGGGFGIDLRAAYKYQTDSVAGYDDDAFEFTANLSRNLGPLKGRLQVQYSPDGTGSTEAWTYVEARLARDFTRNLNGSVALGRREQDNSLDYTGWNAGVTYKIVNNVALDVRWYDTDGPQTNPTYEDALVATLTTTF